MQIELREKLILDAPRAVPPSQTLVKVGTETEPFSFESIADAVLENARKMKWYIDLSDEDDENESEAGSKREKGAAGNSDEDRTYEEMDQDEIREGVESWVRQYKAEDPYAIYSLPGKVFKLHKLSRSD